MRIGCRETIRNSVGGLDDDQGDMCALKVLIDQRQPFCPVPVASPKNVTEVSAHLFGPDWRDYTHDFGIVDHTFCTVYDRVDELFSHHRPPLLEPALQRPQLLGTDSVGVIAHEYFQDPGAAGVGMILQVAKHLGPYVP